MSKSTAKRKLLSKSQRSAIMRKARAAQLRTMRTKAYINAAKSARTLNAWRKQNAQAA